jgi:hypothetical protein
VDLKLLSLLSDSDCIVLVIAAHWLVVYGSYHPEKALRAPAFQIVVQETNIELKDTPANHFNRQEPVMVRAQLNGTTPVSLCHQPPSKIRQPSSR